MHKRTLVGFLFMILGQYALSSEIGCLDCSSSKGKGLEAVFITELSVILVHEGEDAFAHLVEMRLKERGHRVRTFENAKLPEVILPRTLVAFIESQNTELREALAEHYRSAEVVVSIVMQSETEPASNSYCKQRPRDPEFNVRDCVDCSGPHVFVQGRTKKASAIVVDCLQGIMSDANEAFAWAHGW